MMTRDEAMRLAEDVRSFGLRAPLAAIVDRHVAQAEAPGITSTFATLFCASQDMRTAIKQHWPGTTGELYALEEWCRQHRDPERTKEVREAEAQQPDAGADERVPLWAAIGRFVRACGGNPDRNTYSIARQEAVVLVENEIAAAHARGVAEERERWIAKMRDERGDEKPHEGLDDVADYAWRTFSRLIRAAQEGESDGRS